MTSTGSKMDVHGVCTPGSEGVKLDITLHLQALDSENVKGTGKVVMTGGGRTMNGDYKATAKYLGPACGDTQ